MIAKPIDPKEEYIEFLQTTGLQDIKVTVSEALWTHHLKDNPEAQPEPDNTYRISLLDATSALHLSEMKPGEDEQLSYTHTPRSDAIDQALGALLDAVWNGRVTNVTTSALASQLYNASHQPLNVASSGEQAGALTQQIITAAETARAKFKVSMIVRSSSDKPH